MSRSWKLVPLLLILCFATYWPALDNGFISDDYVLLERVETWSQDFSYLFTIPPENFRMTEYAAFRLLKMIFGYRSEFFYVFAILIHFLNCLLLYRLVSILSGNLTTATLAAALFAVVQNPQEAVMWFAGINELLLGAFLLATLLLWAKRRFLWSVLAYLAALFSKESAPVVLLLVPLVEFWRTRRAPPKKEYCYFLLATLIWGGLFIYTAPTNHHIVHGFYNFGAHALAVLVKSLHRLAFPWLYLALLMTIRQHRSWPRDAMAVTLAWMGMALLPYVFLTYQDHVPSRNTYLASMGLVTTLGILIQTESRIRLQRTFVAAFLAVNIGYIWFVKDAQFETRAAPTTELVKELRSRSPGPLLVMDFPANPWMAKLTSRMVPGWQPEFIIVNKPEETCLDCVKLRWDSERQEYTSATQSKPR